MDAATSRALADAILAAHVGFAAFVVLGLVGILVGGALRWRWVRDPYFRALHLAVAHWLGRLLYWQAPPWVFTLGYTLFGAAVVSGWWLVPPRGFRDARHQRRDAGVAHDETARPTDGPDGP